MKSTSSTYKQIIASGNTRNYLVTINMTLADETELTLTEENIMQGSFKITSASSGDSSFDIGSAIIGKCEFTLKNYDDTFTDYDFFNATAVVWVKLVGDSEYHRMGFYTVDEPTFAGSLVKLELLDNMWKLDVPLEDVHLSYPVTALSAINSICSHCGVTLATQDFHGKNFSISKAPEGDMNCREFLQYVAMIGCNFCDMNDQGYLRIRWYADPPAELPDDSVAYFTSLRSRTIGTDELTVTGVKIKIDETEHLVGYEGYVIELENPLVDENNVNTVLNLIWDVLGGFKIRTFLITGLADLAPEIGDYCGVAYKNTIIYSHITNYTFTPSMTTASLGAYTPTRSLTKRYSKTVQAAVEEARKKTDEVISDYDLAVQIMNDLAVNAMGGYEDFEDLPTGGRVWYLSNRPITKVGNVCSFETGSTVFKRTGEGLYVSTDGGHTWVNGYNAQTGQLVVNVLNAIGISAEWIKTGTLDVGGSGTNAVIRVKDSSDNIICTINQQGITMSKGVLQSADYSYTSGNYSDSGMIIDLINSYMRATAFELSNVGGHIGKAEFDEDSLQIVGDIELFNGSGSFTFRPTDYYIAQDFFLLFKTESGTSTVTVVRHRNNTDTTIGTYTADTEGTNSDLLDHTIGTNPSDYYSVTCSDPCSVSIENAYLAYMGVDGFRGTLQGIFKGYIESHKAKIGNVYFNGSEIEVEESLDIDVITQEGYGDVSISGTELSLSDHEKGNIVLETNRAYTDEQSQTVYKPTITREYDLDQSSHRGSEVIWDDELLDPLDRSLYGINGISITKDTSRNKIVISNTDVGTHTYSYDEHMVGRWVNGNDIYEKTIRLGSLPSNATSRYEHNLGGFGLIIYYKGVKKENGVYVDLLCDNRITIDGTYINVTTSKAQTGSAYITIGYTKPSSGGYYTDSPYYATDTGLICTGWYQSSTKNVAGDSYCGMIVGNNNGMCHFCTFAISKTQNVANGMSYRYGLYPGSITYDGETWYYSTDAVQGSSGSNVDNTNPASRRFVGSLYEATTAAIETTLREFLDSIYS